MPKLRLHSYGREYSHPEFRPSVELERDHLHNHVHHEQFALGSMPSPIHRLDKRLGIVHK